MLAQQPELKHIEHAYFRANPAYELVLFDRLSDNQQAELAILQNDPSFYGILQPCTANLQLKSVDQDTALLFLTLQQPGAVPTYVRAKLGERCNQVVAQLVLDGVLEMSLSQDETFVSGAAAYNRIYDEIVTTQKPITHHISQLALDALNYAQALVNLSIPELATRLYIYNTIPISATWRHRLPTPDATAAFLQIGAGDVNHRLLSRHWRFYNSTNRDSGWLTWQTRHTESSTIIVPHELNYKLYISPLPHSIPAILGSVLGVLTDTKVPYFKIGADAYGLLRPDKIVVYCTRFEELAIVADRLATALSGCPAQGVPFTAPIDAAGLLSWGMDPPLETSASTNLPRESWRQWVVNQLALALATARNDSITLPPWRFALDRLQLEGIDTTTWTPKQTIWQVRRI